jgi:glutathione S-transferase
MLYLYHAVTSVCAIKVRLTLAEKALPWEGELLDLRRGDQHRAQYLELNPNGVVPTLVHDGNVLLESTLIIEYLEAAFPEVRLMPADPYARYRARSWMKKIDDYLHAACSALTFAIAFRKTMLRMGPEALAEHLKRIPNPEYRERQRLSLAQGLDAPQAAHALRQYDRFIGEMEEALSATPYLAGIDFTLADAAAIPYVNRAQMLSLDPLWKGRRPAVADWLARMRERPSFDYAIGAWMTDADKERFVITGDDERRSIARLLDTISPTREETS